jgi:hypothetical protein
VLGSVFCDFGVPASAFEARRVEDAGRGLAGLLINGQLFNIGEPVFTHVGMTSTQSRLRNAVLSFLTAHAFSKLEDLFAHSLKSPILFARLLRTLFFHALTNNFFARECSCRR